MRPVFYLTSDTTFKSGTTGSKDNPYIIDGIKETSLGEFCDGQTNMGTCITSKKDIIGNVTNMTSTLTGGMYRYQGTDNVNNWICFGTSNKEECTSGGDTYGNGIDKYMYRIIGVTSSGELALIKETGVKENASTPFFTWDDSSYVSVCGTNGENCTWPLSTLYNRLNGLCTPSNINCTGTGSGYNGQTNIFIGNNYYEYLNNNSTWLNKIISHNWKYGDTNLNGQYNADNMYNNKMYNIENAFNNTKEAKIGLMYIHDYLYTYSNENNITTDNVDSMSWITFPKDGYNYMFQHEWLLTRDGVFSSNNTSVVGSAVLSIEIVSSPIDNPNYIGARPVFYLTPSVKISNTTGSKTDPFLIMN